MLSHSYSFALEECNEREMAERLARKALDMNKNTPYAIHAIGELVPVINIIFLPELPIL